MIGDNPSCFCFNILANPSFLTVFFFLVIFTHHFLVSIISTNLLVLATLTNNLVLAKPQMYYNILQQNDPVTAL